MSIYVLQVDTHVLHLVHDEAAVRALCPVSEVRAERWLFFAEDGSPLRPQFLPAEAGGTGYYLRPWASCGSCSLSQVLPFVTDLQGPESLGALRARLGVPAA